MWISDNAAENYRQLIASDGRTFAQLAEQARKDGSYELARWAEDEQRSADEAAQARAAAAVDAEARRKVAADAAAEAVRVEAERVAALGKNDSQAEVDRLAAPLAGEQPATPVENKDQAAVNAAAADDAGEQPAPRRRRNAANVNADPTDQVHKA